MTSTSSGPPGAPRRTTAGSRSPARSGATGRPRRAAARSTRPSGTLSHRCVTAGPPRARRTISSTGALDATCAARARRSGEDTRLGHVDVDQLGALVGEQELPHLVGVGRSAALDHEDQPVALAVALHVAQQQPGVGQRGDLDLAGLRGRPAGEGGEHGRDAAALEQVEVAGDHRDGVTARAGRGPGWRSRRARRSRASRRRASGGAWRGAPRARRRWAARTGCCRSPASIQRCRS